MNKKKLIELLDLLDRAQDLMDTIDDHEAERLNGIIMKIYGHISKFRQEAKHLGVSLD